MARQETISLIALLVSIAGIAALLFLAESFEPKEVKIGEIDRSLIGWHVKVNALVKTHYWSNGTLLMELDDGTGKLKAVIFKAGEQAGIARKGNFASFEGKIQEYKNELEIVVEKVEEWH